MTLAPGLCLRLTRDKDAFDAGDRCHPRGGIEDGSRTFREVYSAAKGRRIKHKHQHTTDVLIGRVIGVLCTVRAHRQTAEQRRRESKSISFVPRDGSTQRQEHSTIVQITGHIAWCAMPIEDTSRRQGQPLRLGLAHFALGDRRRGGVVDHGKSTGSGDADRPGVRYVILGVPFALDAMSSS